MKTFLPTIFTFATLMGLVGCGSGGNTNASLKVSSAFVMTNPNFGGGLIITGKNISNGKSFSRGLTTAMSMDIVLEKGTWLITAVGWDGGTSSNVAFAGKPYCGKIQKDLTNSSETIDLNVTQGECATSFFAGTHADTVSTPNTIKNIGLINTCQTFFNGSQLPTDQIYDEIVTAGTGSADFCETLASDMKTKVGAIKIYAMNKDLNASTPLLGFSSACIQSSLSAQSKIEPAGASPTNPYQSGHELRLPVGGSQFTIVTYRDSSCSEPIAHFPFKNGLGSGDPSNFDHLLYTYGSNDLKLILPSNDMRRAMSPFHALLPFFKRNNSGSPVKFQTEPSSIGTYLFRGVINQNTKVILEDQNACSTVATAGIVTSAVCSDLLGRVQISFSGTTQGPGSFTMNSQTYPVYLDNETYGVDRFEAQKLSMDLVGHDGDHSISNFFDFKDRDDNEYGALSVIRNIFSANGAGGLLGVSNTSNTFSQECADKNEDKTVSMFNHDRLQMETYRVVIHNNTVSEATNFICSNGNMNESSCFAPEFEKRMLVYDHKISAIQPAMVFEFSCQNLHGRFEMNQIETEGANKEEVKQFINWNTNSIADLGYQRFERMLHLKSFNQIAGNWIQKSETRQMARVAKNGGDDYEAWTFTFHTDKNLSNTFDQMMIFRRLKTGSTTTLNYAVDDAFTTNANPTFILSDSSFDALLDRMPSSSESGTNYFEPYSTFPQNPSGVAATFYSLSSDFSNTDEMNENLTFKLRTLGQPIFLNTFGGTFYTSP